VVARRANADKKESKRDKKMVMRDKKVVARQRRTKFIYFLFLEKFNILEN
jgi:hypothetical protein